MRRYILDSNAVNAWSERRQPLYAKAQAAIKRGDRLGTCEPIIMELHFGLAFSASREATAVRLNRALIHLKVWPFDRAAALHAAEIMADLKRRGQPIQIVDIQLAAIALAMGNTTVVSTDTDLLRVSGLSVENWMDSP